STTLGVPGALISVFDAASNQYVVNTVADGSGGYDTDAILPAGSYKIDASAPGYVLQWWNNQLFSQQADLVTLGPDASGIDFVLVPGGSISGQVKSCGGAGCGIGGVTVSASAATPGIPGASATTASDGSFTVSGLLTGTYKLQALPAGVPPVG